MSAGELRNPVRIQRRVSVKGDKYGRPAGAWADLFAGVRFVKITARNAGGEVNVGERLEGRQPYEILIRLDPETETITNGDSILSEVSPHKGRFNIASVAPWRVNPAYLLATCDIGGADG